MAIKAVGETLDVNDVVQLTAQFYDSFGNPANTDTLPQISIVTPSGLVGLNYTSAGVSQISVGKYAYSFTIPFNGPYGVWANLWRGTVAGTTTVQTLNFVVSHGDLPAVGYSYDGYLALGDDIGFNYSQVAIRNIDKLLKMLRARLNSSGKAKSTDGFGNVIYVDCDVFSVDMLTTFLATALSEFNAIPYFTNYSFDNTAAIDQFGAVLVEGAALQALASQALIERGREFQLSDSGIQFTPPSMSELLETQFSTQLTIYWDKLKYIKNSIRSGPLGLGILQPLSNVLLSKLRHRRSNQII